MWTRLVEEIEKKGSLSRRQFYFNKERSTIQVINKIVETAENTMEKKVM